MARSAAQSSASMNNLRQIGMAGINYESRNGHFLPGKGETNRMMGVWCMMVWVY